jgi:pyrroline-5-carboxylate reductase
MINKKLTIIGCGNMGSAILQAILHNQIFAGPSITLVEKVKNKTIEQFLLQGVLQIRELDDLSSGQEFIILAVKPQNAEEVLKALQPKVNRKTLVLSIMAGISISVVERELGQLQILRTMPNTPCAINQGMSVYCGNKLVTAESYHLADKILNVLGKALQVKNERMIDAATAISGSGPAYLFHLAESLQEGAIELGFNEEQAQILATQTLLGATLLLDQSTDNAGALRKKVTSPNGTTEAALNSFAENQIKEKLKQGFTAAYKRSIELGR